ncbi:MAG: hypothetical protein ACRD5R_06435 [Candidatus Acidiferrales bacterium]
MKSTRLAAILRATLPVTEKIRDMDHAGRDDKHSSSTVRDDRHRVFGIVWISINILFLIFLLVSMYAVGWEYSTRRYLKGFSDAVIPAQSSPQDEIGAILDWMARGPARLPAGPVANTPDRDPTDTLNYKSLLAVCGTATNAFINLADSGGLSVRRLLLLGPDHETRHVVAEVHAGDRWIVVDPTFRTIPRGADGDFLTRQELADPAIFAAATKNIPNYDSNYTYNRTAHVHLLRMRFIGKPLRIVLDHILPGWEDSATMSLLLERRSFAVMTISIFFLLICILLRIALRWYGESMLGVRFVRLRTQFYRAAQAFLDTSR